MWKLFGDLLGNGCDDCDDSDPNLTIPGNPCDDNDDYTIDDSINENCECLGIQPIPTLTQWGLIILGLFLSIFGIVAVRQKSNSF